MQCPDASCLASSDGMSFTCITCSPLFFSCFHAFQGVRGSAGRGLPRFWWVSFLQAALNSVHTRCIVRHVDLQGVFVKIGDSIKFKTFSCGIPREQAILRKSKTPRKSPEKLTFLSLAFYNAPSLDSVEALGFRRKKYYYFVLPFLVLDQEFNAFSEMRSAIIRPHDPLRFFS